VGPEKLLAVEWIRGIRLSWAGLPPAGAEAGDEFACEAQVRAHGDPVPARARVEPASGTAEPASGTVDGAPGPVLHLTLDEPLRGVAPGQTVVLYQGTRVLGQATIDAARALDRVG
jgi:tRNA-specific 2-thiouridylase